MPARGATGDTQQTQAGAVPAPEHADGARQAPAAEVVERDERRAKMERLRAEGIDPYPHGSWMERRTLIKDVLAAHDPSELGAGEHPEIRYLVAGRLIARRGHGKTSLLDLPGLSGSIQIVVRADAIGGQSFHRLMGPGIGGIVAGDRVGVGN